MSDRGAPLSYPRPTSKSKPIPSLTYSSSSDVPPSFAGLKTPSVARKKPAGLKLKPTRVAPAPGDGAKDGPVVLSGSEQLRQEIERLQLSSRSSSSTQSGGLDSPTSSSPTAPTTPNQLAASDTSSQGSRKKSSSSSKTGKKHRDKDAEDLVKDEDLNVLGDLGAGNGGTVTKVWNKKRNCIMARKESLPRELKIFRKQIIRELQIMNDCSSPYIVEYYGCFPVDVHVGIVMEYMDAGSLDHIYRRNGAIPIQMVGKVAEAVLKGLMYLYDVHRIIHRDIKPSNILANTAGDIKICDFGVSGELINSIANTFVGTSTYMSPERIQGAPYTIKSDVWSLGISLVELALGRFPFSDSPDDEDESELELDPDATLPLNSARPKLKPKNSGEGKSAGVSLAGGGHSMSILDLLQHIVNEPAPRLEKKGRTYPPEAAAFVEGCLHKDPATRKSPQELLVSFPQVDLAAADALKASDWITKSSVTKDDLKAWTKSVTQAE
ncbi:kinase-like domain-containing protein [Naematelia encephala]|uniref:Kinase-like domain-containing protein n=1 Tax=Naematelia encephala TaxID=71784 RepID=A0A1Y2ALV6_9TREE|nr:kinase-like domain-containing protein [Naematelia encephala]